MPTIHRTQAVIAKVFWQARTYPAYDVRLSGMRAGGSVRSVRLTYESMADADLFDAKECAWLSHPLHENLDMHR